MCKYYGFGIKLETKVMRLHKIRIEKISLFHLKKCAVNDLTITCNVSSLTSLTSAKDFRNLISMVTWCIN